MSQNPVLPHTPQLASFNVLTQHFVRQSLSKQSPFAAHELPASEFGDGVKVLILSMNTVHKFGAYRVL